MLEFSWVTQLSAWAGLGTLVLLEVVLGVDNLVFISILVGRLPGDRKRQAFLVGLGLALLMRMILLTIMARLATLITPLFVLGGTAFQRVTSYSWPGASFCCSRAPWSCTTGLKATAADMPEKRSTIPDSGR